MMSEPATSTFFHGSMSGREAIPFRELLDLRRSQTGKTNWQPAERRHATLNPSKDGREDQLSDADREGSDIGKIIIDAWLSVARRDSVGGRIFARNRCRVVLLLVTPTEQMPLTRSSETAVPLAEKRRRQIRDLPAPSMLLLSGTDEIHARARSRRKICGSNTFSRPEPP